MRRVLALLSVVFILTGAAFAAAAGEKAPRITKEELRDKLNSPDIVLIDVRTFKDWELSGEKIVGARRMEAGSVDSWAETLPKEKEIILYCA